MSALPLTLYDQQIYLDVDAVGFRTIVAIFKRTISLTELLGKASALEIALFKATAQDLHCGRIISEIDQKAMKSEDEQKAKNAIRSKMETLPMSEITCSARQLYRSYNRCGRTSILSPAKIVDGTEEYACTGCDNGSSGPFTMDRIPNMQRFDQVIDNICYDSD
jgi:hypothetical protein